MNGLFVVPDDGCLPDIEVSDQVLAALSQLARTTSTVTGMVRGLAAITVWACGVNVVEVMIAASNSGALRGERRRPIDPAPPLARSPGQALTVVLAAEGRELGVLTLFRSDARGWTGSELAVARLVADVSASYLALAADRDPFPDVHRMSKHRATVTASITT